MNKSCHTYECVTSRIWVSYGTHMNATCHTYECVTSHIWMRHVTHMNDASCCTLEWVMSRIWMSRPLFSFCACTCVHVRALAYSLSFFSFLSHDAIQSFHTYEWVMSHIWMSHVTHTNARDSTRASKRGERALSPTRPLVFLSLPLAGEIQHPNRSNQYEWEHINLNPNA